MPKIIGYLKNLNGELFAKDPEGHLRPLHPGDPVYVGEVVVDAAGRIVPDALQDAKSETPEGNLGEEHAQAQLGEEEEGKHAKKTVPPKGVDVDHIDPEDVREVDVNAPLRTSEFLDSYGGIPRHELEGEVNINAPLYDARFQDHEFPPFPEGPGNNPVKLSIGGVNEVWEAGLDDGTRRDDSDIATGTLEIQAVDGLKEITFDGGTGPVTFTRSQIDSSSSSPLQVDTGEGTLKIIGATKSGGGYTLQYEYILKDNLDHTKPTHDENLFDPISITVKDVNGDEAAGTLTITIVDDVPEANPDVNDVTEDAPDAPGHDDSNPDTTIIVGNISDNDIEGADQPSPITAISSLNTGVAGSVGTTLDGAYGKLTLQADGSYEYALNNNNPAVQSLSTGDKLTEVFRYSITDSDGDSSTTKLTITIHGTGDEPIITPDGDKTVYEEGLDNPGDDQGTDAASDKEYTTGTIDIVAKDGLDHITIAGTDVSEAQLLNSATTPIVITTTYGELTITNFTPTDPTHQEGNGTIDYTYELTDNTLDHTHSDPIKDTEVVDVISLEVTERDGSVATGTLNVTVVDDVPSITLETKTDPADTLTVDETTLATDAKADFADNFTSTSKYGADGVGTITSDYAFSVTAGSTGLVDTATGQDVVLGLKSGTTNVIEGKNTDGDIVFTLSVDANGEVTLDQQRAVVHSDTSTPDDSVTLSDGVITLSRTDVITDGDGDTATSSATIDLGANLVFKDDGPKAAIPDASFTATAATLDESALTDDGKYSATVDVSGAFTGAAGDFGTDGAAATGATTYAVSLTTSSDTGSGLYILDPSAADGKGAEIQLHDNGNGTVSGLDGSTEVFKISVDNNGKVTFAYSDTTDPANIWHDQTPANDGDNAEVLKTAVAGALVVTQTLTDADGDSVTSDGFDIGTGDFLSIEDDGPAALADSNHIQEGTGISTVEGDVLNATVGSSTGDQADMLSTDAPVTVTGVASGTDTDNPVSGNIGTTFDVNYGTITMQSDGTYKYHLNELNPDVLALVDGETLQENLVYTITDGDGDQSTTTLDITIEGKTGSMALVVDAHDVDEAGLAVPGTPPIIGSEESSATSDDSQSEIARGTFRFVAEDGVDYIEVAGTKVEFDNNNLSDSLPITIDTGKGYVTLDTYSKSIIQASTGEQFELHTIDYTYELYVNQDHSAGEVHDLIDVTVVSKATGAPSVSKNIDINIIDDDPSIEVKTTEPADTLTVDETTLATDAKADFSDNFTSTSKYGADGAGTITSDYKFTIDTSKPTGLKDTATGDDVVLSLNGNVVEGKNGAGDIVFTLSVDANGEVTLDQQRAVVHPDYPNDYDEPISLDNDLIKLTRTDTITDGDGDTNTASASIDLGTNLVFKDDGPTPSTSIDDTANAIVDETDFTPHDPSGKTSVVITDTIIQGLFDTNSSFGADGAGSITYSLKAGSLNTGLYLSGADQTDPANEIILTEVTNAPGDIVAYKGMVGSTEAFSIAIDNASGEVTVTQKEALSHPNPNDPDDTLKLDTAAIKVVQTVTDKDKDSVTTDSKNALDITFKDDGPTAAVDSSQSIATITVDESPVAPNGDGIVSATADYSVNFAAKSDFGTDGAANTGSRVYELTFNGTDVDSGLKDLDGNPIVMNLVGGEIVGTVGTTEYFRISADSATGRVTFTQSNNIQHPAAGSTPADHDDAAVIDAVVGTIGLKMTLTDKDGDSASDTLDLSKNVFTIEDDGPTVVVDSSSVAAIVVDESPLPNDTPAGDGIRSETVNYSGNFSTSSYGTDGAADTSSRVYELTLSGTDVDSGLKNLDGKPIVMNLVGGEIVGTVGTTKYFSISADTATGEVTFTQSENVWHPTAGSTPADHDDPAVIDAAAGSIGLKMTLTDKDGDSASDTLDLSTGVFTIEDDGPTANSVDSDPAATLKLDESLLPSDTPPGDGIRTTFADYSGHFGTTNDFGTDGKGSIGYSMALNGSSLGTGLYALDPSNDGTGAKPIGQGDEIVLSLDASGNVIGTAGGTTYFTISTDNNGNVTFTQNANIWHPDPGLPGQDPDLHDEQAILNAVENTLVLRQTITDKDGDTDSSDFDLSQGVFIIEDDGPVIGDGQPDGLVDEAGLPRGSHAGDDAYPIVAEGTLDVKSGTDGVDTIFTQATIDGLPALTSNGQEITYAIDNYNHRLIASADLGGSTPTVIFQVDIVNASTTNASYKFTLHEPIDHASGGGTNLQDLTFNFVTIDTDGDTAIEDFKVSIKDDISTGELDIELDEDGYKEFSVSADHIDATSINITGVNHGTVTYEAATNLFMYKPNGDYSGLDTFRIQATDVDGDPIDMVISATVHPISDPPTMQDDINLVTEEDASNTEEGTNVVKLGLQLPTLNDQTDQSTTDETDTLSYDEALDDAPERLGLITFDFSPSGDNVNGTKVFVDSNDNGVFDSGDQLLLDVSSADKSFTVKITDVPNYHPNDIGDADFNLSKADYEKIAVLQVEDNANNIKFDIKAQQHEVQDSGDLWSPDIASSVETQHVTVNVQAVTDPVSITLHDTDDTSTDPEADVENITIDSPTEFTLDIKEDMKVELTDVLEEGFGDFDGSETYRYKIEGVPEGTIFSVDGHSVKVGASGTAFVDFTSTEPKVFITPPKNYSGSVTGATLTLIATDHELHGETDLAPAIVDQTAVVTFNMNVQPVVDGVVVSISQANGPEDSGREADGTISPASAADGIEMDANVRTLDTDGSEHINVYFDKIPDDAAIYYDIDGDGTKEIIVKGGVLTGYDASGNAIIDNTLLSTTVSDAPLGGGDTNVITDNGDGTWKLLVENYTDTGISSREKPLFIPQHNSNEDVELKISGYSVDTGDSMTVTSAVSSPYTLEIIVKGVADDVINNEITKEDIDIAISDTDPDIGDLTVTLNGDPGKYSAVVEEDMGNTQAGAEFNLKDIYKTPDQIDSYDNRYSNNPDQSQDADTSVASETVSIIITGLDDRFDVQGATLVGGTGDERVWVTNVDAINNVDNPVKITTVKHFSGEINFKIGYVTTENDGDTNTSTVQDVSLLVTPEAEGITNILQASSDVNEDELTHMTFYTETKLPDTDEYLSSLGIARTNYRANGEDFKGVDGADFTIYIVEKDSDGNITNKTSLQDALDAGMIGEETITDDNGVDVKFYKITDPDHYDNLYVLYNADIGGKEDPNNVSTPHQMDFGFKFDVSDKAQAVQNGTDIDLIDTQSGFQDSAHYTFNLHPVTDDITADAQGDDISEADGDGKTEIGVLGHEITISAPTIIDVKVTNAGVNTPNENGTGPNGENGLDIDSSEQIRSIRIDGVPDGIGIIGGKYIGDTVDDDGNPTGNNTWLVDLDQNPIVMDAATKTYNLQFEVSGNYINAASATSNVDISFINQEYDTDGNPQATAQTGDFTLVFKRDPNFSGTTDDAPMDIIGVTDVNGDKTIDEKDGYTVDPNFDKNPDEYQGGFKEDTPTKLGEIIHLDINDVQGSTNAELHETINSDLFSITVQGLDLSIVDVSAGGQPIHSGVVTGWRFETADDGTQILTYRGSGDKAAIENALNALEITPQQDRNHNNVNLVGQDDITFTTTLTTYTQSGVKDVVSTSFSGNIEPVTDPVTIQPEQVDVTEDVESTVTFTLDTVDNQFGSVYAHLVTSPTDDTPPTTISVTYTGSTDVGNGQFGVTLGGVHFNPGDTKDVPITLKGDGTVDLTFLADSNESGKAYFEYTVYSKEDHAQNTNAHTGTIEFDIAPVADGLDTGGGNAKADGLEDEFIQITTASGGAFTGDLIDKLPENTTPEELKTVIIDDVPVGWLVYYGPSKTLAQNLGDTDGNGKNSWNIPLDGTTVPEMWIKAPEQLGGVTETFQLKTGVIDGGEQVYSSVPIDVTVTAVADPITINPSSTGGAEGSEIQLNFNASSVDIDGSEHYEVQLTNLGEGAVFYLDGSELTTADVTYDRGSDTYTISKDAGIDYSTIDNLTVVQNDMSATIDTTITVYDADPNDGTTQTDSGSFALNISQQFGTGGDDTLLYDTKGVNGGAGTDTIVFGTDWDGQNTIDLSALKNVEILDLTQHGDHDLGTLTLSDVVGMTDSNNALTIEGDTAADKVAFDSAEGWVKGADDGTYTTYTNSNDPTVTVKVDDDITVTVA